MTTIKTPQPGKRFLCPECEKVCRPHNDCVFCPECGQLFARIDVPKTSPDYNEWGFVTTGTNVGGGRVARRNRAELAQRKTARRVRKPTLTQGGLFDG